MPDMEQVAILEVVAQALPEQLNARCEELPRGGIVYQNCVRKNSRPHLQVQAVSRERGVLRSRPGGGPVGTHLPIPALDPPLSALEGVALPDSCPMRDGCVLTNALALLTREGVREAASLCLVGFPEIGQVRSECLFRVAETHVRNQGIDGFEESMRICVSAGSLATACIHHVLALSLPPAASSQAPGQHAIDALLAVQERVGTVVGPGFDKHFQDYSWALSTQASFAESARVSGDLLDLLPAEARPHVVQAAAFRLLRSRVWGEEIKLESLVQELKTALEARVAAESRVSQTTQVQLFKPGADYWPGDRLAQEANIPAAYCLGAGRRPTSNEWDLELALVLLEASGRLRTPPPRAFYLGLLATDWPPLVRWTAARLATRDHGPVTDVVDPDPLVMARLTIIR